MSRNASARSVGAVGLLALSGLALALALAGAAGAVPLDVYDHPGKYAGRFDGVTPSGGEVSGPVQVLGPADFVERARRGALRTLTMQVPPGALAAALAATDRSRRVSSGRLRVAGRDGSQVEIEIRAPAVTVTKGGASGSAVRMGLRFQPAVVREPAERTRGTGGYPDRPLVLGTVPNPRVGSNQTLTVGSDRSLTVGAAPDPAPPPRAGGPPTATSMSLEGGVRIPVELVQPHGLGSLALDGAGSIWIRVGGAHAGAMASAIEGKARIPWIELVGGSAGSRRVVRLFDVEVRREAGDSPVPRAGRYSWAWVLRYQRIEIGAGERPGSFSGEEAAIPGQADDLLLPDVVSFSIPNTGSGRANVLWLKVRLKREFPRSMGPARVVLRILDARHPNWVSETLPYLERAAGERRPISQLWLLTRKAGIVVLQEVEVVSVERGGNLELSYRALLVRRLASPPLTPE